MMKLNSNTHPLWHTLVLDWRVVLVVRIPKHCLPTDLGFDLDLEDGSKLRWIPIGWYCRCHPRRIVMASREMILGSDFGILALHRRCGGCDPGVQLPLSILIRLRVSGLSVSPAYVEELLVPNRMVVCPGRHFDDLVRWRRWWKIQASIRVFREKWGVPSSWFVVYLLYSLLDLPSKLARVRHER